MAVDTDLFTLEQYRRISPWLIKPNIHELRHVVEVPGTTITDVVSAARRLADAGVENVLVSLGGNGWSASAGIPKTARGRPFAPWCPRWR